MNETYNFILAHSMLIGIKEIKYKIQFLKVGRKKFLSYLDSKR